MVCSRMLCKALRAFWVVSLLVAVQTLPAAAEGLSQLDLNKATIQSTLSALPADDSVLIEFFASWCPACRAFKPEYEKAATFLLRHSSVHVYRLDCATDPDVCDKYKVSGYPTMYVGKAADVAAVAVDKMTKFDYGLFKRSGAGVVQFVAKQLNLDLKYVEEPEEGPEAAAKGANSTGAAATATASNTMQWTAADVESATRQLFTSITAFHPTEGLQERRAALIMLLKMWSAGHPLDACRSGSKALMQELPQLWPEDARKDPWGEGSTVKAPTDVCTASGQSAPAAPAGQAAGQYVACKGSKPDSRGFTCGLWLLFHTTAARLPEKDGGALLVSALQGFAKYFFQCEVCRSHFVKITSAPEAAAIRSRRDGVLWLWRVHNEVNERLHKVETKYGHSSTGDPAFPKEQWPSTANCPKCRVSSKADSPTQPVQWNEEEVYQLLVRHYGQQARHLQGAAAGGSAASRQGDREGGSAIMQAALEAEAEAAAGRAGLSEWMTAPTIVCTLFVFGLVVWCLMQRSGRSSSLRRPLTMKGPGAHSLNGKHLPRYGRANVVRAGF